MIVLDQADLTSQEGMERAFRRYFEEAREAFDGQFNTMLGTELSSCSYERKTVTLTVEPRPWMSNPMDILHGGITASLLDLTMGLLCRYFSGGYMTPTISMDVQFLRSGPLDRKLYIYAELTKRGMGVCYAVGRMWAEGTEAQLLATSSGAYYVTKQVRRE